MRKKLLMTLLCGSIISLIGCKNNNEPIDTKQPNNDLYVYSIQTIKSIGNIKSVKETKCDYIDNIDCTIYEQTDSDGEWTDVKFYLFKNKESADKAYMYIENKWFFEDADKNKNSISGKEYGICDAEVYLYVYKSYNLIITREDYLLGFSETSLSDDEIKQQKDDKEQILKESKNRHKEIETTW